MNRYKNANRFEVNDVAKYYYNLIKDLKLKKKQLTNFKVKKYKVYLKNPASDGQNVRSVVEKFFLD